MEMENRANEATKVTVIGMIINILLTGFKFLVGILFSSMALIADGLHSLSDMVSDIFIIISFQISKKPADDNHNYGHGRFEVLGEVIVAATLLIVAVNMIKSGAVEIRDFYNNPIAEPSYYTLLVAFISIVSKEALYWYTLFYAKKLNSNSMKANAIHHRTDAISSIAVLVALGAAKLHGPSWYILDPIVAICVAVYIIIIAIRIAVESFKVLSDASVSKNEHDRLMNILNNIPETSDPHNVRTRKIGSYIAVDFHIRVNPDMPIRKAHVISRDIEEKIREEFGRETFISVHMEPEKVNGEYK